MYQVRVSATARAIVCSDDYVRVAQYVWTLRKGYPYSNALYLHLHQYVLGNRPADIPTDYVIDHIDRNVLNADVQNLRWVSRGFNAWNKTVQARNHYRGVHWEPRTDMWAVHFQNRHVGQFSNARDAFVAYATAVVRTWPIWAPTSDLLVGEGLLTKEEMQTIVTSPYQHKVKRRLFECVSQTKWGYQVKIEGSYHGHFATLQEAKNMSGQVQVAARLRKWKEHARLSVPLNCNGQAVLFLSGENGSEKYTTVPAQLYHILTFRHSWNYDNQGYAIGSWSGHIKKLHAVVYQLLHPMYMSTSEYSIDHINHDCLDNTEGNLRLASRSQQERNKRKMSGTSSRYIGVSYDKRNKSNPWSAKFRYKYTQHYVGNFATEESAKDALEKKKLEIIDISEQV